MFTPTVRTTKKEGVANLKTQIRVGHTSKWFDLMCEVDLKTWSGLDTPTKRDNYLKKKGYYNKLIEIDSNLLILKKEGRFNEVAIQTMIRDVMLAEKRKTLREKEKLGKSLKKETERSIRNYVTSFVKGIKSGEICKKKDGARYSFNTVKSWNSFEKAFLRFLKDNPFSWEDIDEKLINKFRNYLQEDCQYLLKTQQKYMKYLKQIISDAEEKELHQNFKAKNLVKFVTVREKDKATEIYLTLEELDALYNMKLCGFEEQVRDVFLIGCFTGQRVSDYTNIHKSNIGYTSKGTHVIRLVQQKTQSQVVIPIVDKRLELLLQKYDYNIPKIADQNINRTIKVIGERLSKTVLSLAQKSETVLTLQEKTAEKRGERVFERNEQGNVVKAKFMMITTHSARRTCITNMYLSGKYTTPQMMKVSGHKDVKTFLDYVKLTQDEYADSVSEASGDGMF
jgi:integrase